MTRVALTGAGGFLGLHVRAALQERGDDVVLVSLHPHTDAKDTAALLDSADRIIHLAGINRGIEGEVVAGNIALARHLADAIARTSRPPAEIVYAGTTHSDGPGGYGASKAEAGAILSAVSNALATRFSEVRLPNVFGEHGRPFYNSVTSTFCHQLVHGEPPTIMVDRELALVHAQDVADVMVGNTSPEDLAARVTRESVSDLLARLRGIADVYRSGSIPDLGAPFARDLFNTYRSHLTGGRLGLPLERRTDARGAFVESVRSLGGRSQSSFSTTAPGASRGGHFHRRKIERFVVLAGRARIEMRRLFTSEVVGIEVDGEQPVAVDMPTLWAHRITNLGPDVLYTSFWTDDPFDPIRPDTIPEPV